MRRGNVCLVPLAACFCGFAIAFMVSGMPRSGVKTAVLQPLPTITAGTILQADELRDLGVLTKDPVWLVLLPECQSCSMNAVSKTEIDRLAGGRIIGIAQNPEEAAKWSERRIFTSVHSLRSLSRLVSERDLMAAPFAIRMDVSGTVGEVRLIRRRT